MQYYSKHEYPLLTHAITYDIHGTVALPVFDPSAQSCCIAVVELMRTRLIRCAKHLRSGSLCPCIAIIQYIYMSVVRKYSGLATCMCLCTKFLLIALLIFYKASTHFENSKFVNFD